MLRLLIILVIAFSSGLAIAGSGKVLAPAKFIYHSANPDFSSSEDAVSAARIASFESLAGKRIVWAYFSDNWLKGITFPRAKADIIRKSGHIPFVRLLSRSTEDQTCADKVYSPAKILAGVYDKQIKAYARAVKAYGGPIMMEWGTEANGDWFQWSGPCNGGAKGGPAKVRDAYRRIITLFRGEGAGFVTWVFHMNHESFPAKPWNTYAAYYPGDSYIDWIGVSVYGALTPAEVKAEDTPSFVSKMDLAYPQLASLSRIKPLALLEFEVTQYPGKAKWLRDALKLLAARRWPRIAAISSWNDKWQNPDGTYSNLRLDSSPSAKAAYRNGVASPVFVTVPRIDK
jgi:Glycosyl hydrolase family 26